MFNNIKTYPKSVIDYLRILNYLSFITSQMNIEYNRHIRGERQINEEDVDEIINKIETEINNIHKKEDF